MNPSDPRVKLKEILLSEVILYTRLLRIEEEKKEAMVKLDRDGLEATVRTEADLIDQIRRLEERRIDAVLLVCRQHGLDVRNSGLEEIAEAMDDEWRTELLNLRARLKEVTLDLGKLNDLNKVLCAQSLGHIKRTLHVMTGTEAMGLYTRGGPANDATVPRQLFDLKV